MGRGRAKAKQTKVARELKYSSPDMDLDRLRQEIGTSDGAAGSDAYDDYDEDSVDDDGESAPRRR